MASTGHTHNFLFAATGLGLERRRAGAGLRDVAARRGILAASLRRAARGVRERKKNRIRSRDVTRRARKKK